MNFKNNLKRLRLCARLTQQDVAHAFGMSKSGYIKLESGLRGLKTKHILRAAQLYDVSLSDVVQLEENNNAFAFENEPKPHPGERSSSMLKDPQNTFPTGESISTRARTEHPAAPQRTYVLSEELPPLNPSFTPFRDSGQRLRALRLILTETDDVQAFSLRYGFSLHKWNAYELGKRFPTHRDLMRLKQLFGVSTEWVFDGTILLMPAILVEKLHKLEHHMKTIPKQTVSP